MRRSFRAKLLVCFLLTALVTNGAGLLLMYELAHKALFETYRTKVLSVASSIAAGLDGDLHASLRSREDEATEQFHKLREELRQARDANRRPDTWLHFVFTTYPSPADRSTWLIGVSPEESIRDRVHLGDVYRGQRTAALRMGSASVDSFITEDEFGKFLAASAPVRDGAGNAVAMLNVEFDASRVAARMRPVLWAGLLSLGLALALAIGGSIYFSGRVSQPLVSLRDAISEIGHGNFDTRVEITTSDEFATVGRAVNEMAAGLREREAVKGAFARYVSRQVLDKILGSGTMPSVRGDRRRITVLFSDIRSFSTSAESMPPEDVVDLLNEYFGHMVDIVFRNQGTLDKFLGDGLMAIFGAPDDDPDQEENAIRAAIEMQAALAGLRHRDIRIGIGIHSGPAIVGNIGSNQRMEYTAIGDTVNLASRLESATKELGVPIVVSEFTWNAVQGRYPARDLGVIHVKGRAGAVQVYGITPGLPADGESGQETPAEDSAVPSAG
jgi:adenylate cyclase